MAIVPNLARPWQNPDLHWHGNADEVHGAMPVSGEVVIDAGMYYVTATGGSTPRSLSDHLADPVNVKDYGARGDGVTDDTAAFAAAIANGRDVLIPSGQYNITSLTFSNFLSGRIRGAGRDSTKIFVTATGVGMTFNNCQWMQLSDFTIQSYGTPHAIVNCTGIVFTGGSGNAVIERVNFLGFSLEGLKFDGTATPSSGHHLRQCYFLGNKRYQCHAKDANDFVFDANAFGGLGPTVAHAEVGCFLENSDANVYTKNMHWHNVVGLKAVTSHYNRFTDNRVEESDRQNVYVSGCYQTVWVGNTIHTGSQEGNGLYDYVFFTGGGLVTFVGNHVFSWDGGKWGRYGVRFEGACDEVVIGKNTIRGFSASGFGPWGFSSDVARVSGDRILTFNGEGLVGSAAYFLGGPGKSANQVAVTYTPNQRYAVARLYGAVDIDLGVGHNIKLLLIKNGLVSVPEMSVTIVGAAYVGSVHNTAPQILYDAGDSLVIQALTSVVPTTSVRGYLVLLEY